MVNFVFVYPATQNMDKKSYEKVVCTEIGTN